ncbi:MAG: DUF3299 domain-containing protein [Cyclobacteriaceae bacterium]|nr:DUF3299 domain-containing protein [Cyclobacteriaceae bacterium]
MLSIFCKPYCCLSLNATLLYTIALKICLISALCLVAEVAYAQPPGKIDTWEIFATVKFTSKYYKQYKDYFLTPTFDANLRALEGTDMVLSGHYMPLDLPDKKSIIISKYTYAACFFCGGAGPESVAEIQFTKTAPRFKADQIITIKGKLKLNDSNVDHLNFILTEAEVIKP